MARISAKYKNVKVVCIDFTDNIKHTYTGHAKIVLNVYKKSKKCQNGVWRKVNTMILPRNIIKNIGLKMDKNDKKQRECGEICLLEYD